MFEVIPKSIVNTIAFPYHNCPVQSWLAYDGTLSIFQRGMHELS